MIGIIYGNNWATIFEQTKETASQRKEKSKIEPMYKSSVNTLHFYEIKNQGRICCDNVTYSVALPSYCLRRLCCYIESVFYSF